MIAAPCVCCFVPEPVSELRESYVFTPLTVYEDRRSHCGITQLVCENPFWGWETGCTSCAILIFMVAKTENYWLCVILRLCNHFWWPLVAKLWNQYFCHFNIGFLFWYWCSVHLYIQSIVHTKSNQLDLIARNTSVLLSMIIGSRTMQCCKSQL